MCVPGDSEHVSDISGREGGPCVYLGTLNQCGARMWQERLKIILLRISITLPCSKRRIAEHCCVQSVVSLNIAVFKASYR